MYRADRAKEINKMYIRNRKLFKGDFNSLTNEVIGYKDVALGNYIYYNVPIIKSIRRIDLIKNIFFGLVGAVLMYVTVVGMIILAPCSTM